MEVNILINLFESSIGKSSVLTGDDLKSRFYHIWKTEVPLQSICLLLPRSSQDVSNIMKICNENNQEVIIHGGLTNLVGSTKSEKSQVVISLEKMNKIIEVDERGKTVTCESGVIIENIIKSENFENLK